MPVPFLIPMAVTAGMGIADSIYKYHTANQQDKLAKEYGDKPRPVMGIPGGMQESEDIARSAFLDTRMPGQNIMEDKVQAGTSNTLAALQQSGNPADVTASILGLQANENNAMNDIGIQAANMQRQDAQNLQGTMERKAGWEDKVWEYNQNQPYQMNQAAASALREAAMRNKYAAFNSLLGGAGHISGMVYQNEIAKQGLGTGSPGDINGMTQISQELLGYGGSQGSMADFNTTQPGQQNSSPIPYNGVGSEGKWPYNTKEVKTDIFGNPIDPNEEFWKKNARYQ